MKPQTIREIIMLFWVLILLLGVFGLIHNPNIFSYIFTGFAGGFLLNMIINHPLLTAQDNYINFLRKFSKDMIKFYDENKSKGKKK